MKTIKTIKRTLCVCSLLSVQALAGIDDPFTYFNVYSLNDIGSSSRTYSSDFQGTAGAAGDVYFRGFSANGLSRNDYGLHIGGDASLGSGSYLKNVEAGGNVSLQSMNIDGSLYVGGDVSGTSGGTIQGSVNAGGTINLPGSFTAYGGEVSDTAFSPVADHAALSGYFTSVSDYYGSQSATTAYTNSWGNLVIDLDAGLNIVEMTSKEFKNAWGVTITGQEDSSLIINLSGTDVSLNSTNWTWGSNIDSSKVMLNFYEALDLNLSGGNAFNILAPDADTIFSSGLVIGNLIVGNLTGGGQVNEGYFNPGFEVVPEPATVVIMGLGGLMLGLQRKKRLSE